MVAKSSAIHQTEHALRKRMHILERAHAELSSLNAGQDVKILPEMSHLKGTDHHAEETSHSSPTDYESRSESSGSEVEFEHDGRSDTGGEGPSKISNKDQGRRTHSRARSPRSPREERDSSASMSSTSRAWYEFDLAVVVALVSPIGNWLTGGDHIKNLLLILLLIFYLHQVIEVPWSLYQNTRPRRRPSHLPAPSTAEDKYRQLAAYELRTLEFFFLLLATLSPFFGATLLRYASAAIIGPEAVSWFSTGLFVLATGMRPWAHLVERLQERTKDLHDVIHYPPSERELDDVAGSKKEMEELKIRLEKLERGLRKVKDGMKNTTEEVYDYVDETIDAVERSVKKHERQWDKNEGRVKEIEDSVAMLAGKGKGKSTGMLSMDAQVFAHSILAHLLPKWLLSPPERNIYGNTPYTTYPTSPISLKHTHHSHSPLQHSPPPSPSQYFSPPSSSPNYILHSFPSQSNGHLETILEEEGAGAGTYTPVVIPALAQPYRFTSGLFWRAGYLATMPLRAVARMVMRNY